MLLQISYALRSERLLVERLDFDLSFRWFVGLGIDDRVWDASTFSKNRDRLLDGDVAMRFLAAILDRPKVKRLVSTEHFSVDGTLIEAWASMKSFRRRSDDSSGGPPADDGSSGKQPDGRNGEVDFHGEKRSNATHASTTDPDAMLYRKSPGAGAMLCYMGHVLMENRNGLVVDVEATRVSGHAERMAAVEMVKGITSASGTRRVTVGADRGFDARDFVEDMRELGATPHVAQNTSGRRSAPRRAHDTPSRLRAQHQGSKTHRGGVRLGQGGGRAEKDQIPRAPEGAFRLHLRRGRLQSRPIAQAAHRMNEERGRRPRLGRQSQPDTRPSLQPKPTITKNNAGTQGLFHHPAKGAWRAACLRQ